MTTTQDTSIHPTAIVSAQATIEPGAHIGPGCIIDGPATIRSGANLIANVHVAGDTQIGENTTIYPYACVGFGPQHIKIKPGSPIGGLTIGSDCVIREQTTIHAAMEPGTRTIVGNRLFLMATAHIGHDCIIGNDVVMCNGALAAGHVEIHDKAFLSGMVAVHQFCRVGRNAMLGGGTIASSEVPPYCTLVAMNTLGGLNLVGMRRSGISGNDISKTKEAYRKAFRVRLSKDQQLAILDELGESCEPVRLMAEFVRTSKRSVSLGDGKPRPHIMQWLRSDEGRSTLAGNAPQDGTDDGVA